ncbi:hypothetical protein MANES_11G062850v8 [Manihot esculenta]|uniref:Uncharacterized protein n=1 Tax=Manihot esculenta TaxID=3983 RepID=A0ACB7GUZ9_MANES|nr:hypothetical protein MANES_11G062850v8 [Manihot esculenta]
MSLSSSAVVSLASLEDHSRVSEAMITGDYSDCYTSLPSSIAQTFPFSSGNPRIEETRGVMRLFSNDDVSGLPDGRKPSLVCSWVPNHMTCADFCQFCASLLHLILEREVSRTDGMEDQYSILISFDSQDSTDSFHQHLNGRQVNSLEEDNCCVLFIVDIQFTGYSGSLDTQPSPASTTEQPSCPVCLEKLD